MITLQGILYDEKSSYLKGPAKAPPLIREFLYSDSSNLYSETGVNISNVTLFDQGDFQISEYFDIEKFTLKNLSKGGKLITLGGDHSITYPVVKACQEVYGPFEILHLDAHGDLYDSFEGDKYSHACPFARIMEGNHAEKLTQAGIRTMTKEQWETAERFGVKVIEMKDYSLNIIPKFKFPLYISIDMDGFDPAFAPGVSHHEPGGFTSRQVIDLLHSLDADIIGIDIVEYNPDRDINGMTGTLAAKLLKESIALLSKQ